MNKFNQQFKHFHIPRYNELPSIDIYSDQLINYLKDTLEPIQIDKRDSLITTAMINNYVKCGLIPPTVKKRYNRKHIAYLMVICVFKQIYPIPKIIKMIRVQKQHFETETAYDYFCTELENALRTVDISSMKMSKDTSQTGKEERLFVRASIYAFALKYMVENYLDSITENEINNEN
ncbi:DUF1836 domain-containing protein [Anaerorhabdus furcosa]|uniref:DUF1836 domain-containing protein n=1 Tax=Anaerorhabdus furcosa TaxID=118967 RepID=A0A1T4LWP2_9FIRM|nr:DUF1836 domain-containing protein [Anaerorhabdus furcosa]SJZ59169.1 protein of unknown function [Anaerorhabdus furcosa]